MFPKHKRRTWSLRLGIVMLTLACSVSRAAPTDWVDPFIGTSNSRWMLFPGPTLPFGLVKLSPDNQGNVWNGGYEYSVSSIGGFSHLHAMGLSALSVMPTTGSLQTDPTSSRLFPGEADAPFGEMWTAGYHSRIRKETERAAPGYYRVRLEDYGIDAELSATLHCGFLRFTFPATPAAHILLNLDFPAEEAVTVLGVEIERTSANEIEGSVHLKSGYAGDHRYYFVAQFSRPPKSFQTWQNQPYTGGETNYGTHWRQRCTLLTLDRHFAAGAGTGVIANFETQAGEAITVRTALSFVSVANAHLNLNTEATPFGWDLDAVAVAARQTWDSVLGCVEVSGADENEKKKFYTCFYRCFTGKSLLNDVNGEYRDFLGRVQRLAAPADAVYSSDGLWGTQWNLTPLWTLLTPQYANSMANSLLELASRGGWIPEAPVALKYAPIMGGQHQDALLVSLYQKGLARFDPEKAYQAIHHDLTTPGESTQDGGFAGDRQLAVYDKLGYVPDEEGAVSNTLEYAYDDWCAGQFARRLGKTDEANFFEHRSQNYRNLFDPKVGYMRRRHADGSWVAPFDPFLFGTEGGWNGRGFMEGNAWIYTFFVPHDLAGLAKLVGSDRLCARLEKGFDDGSVDLGNEPNLEAPFLFNYFGKPWLTQKFSRYVAKNYYSTSPYFGWKGEEDEGQLSAFYVLIAMGLFEMDGGCSVHPGYDLGSPVFSKIVLHLDRRFFPKGDFTIIAENNSDRNVYVQDARLNGKPLLAPWIDWTAFQQGGELRLTMGPQPRP